MIAAANRLRRHGDYQRVYKSSRKRFGKQMGYFFLLRQSQPISESKALLQPLAGPRVGLTVGRAMGKAVQRNRIKRRMREAIRNQICILEAPVDVILHPNRRVAEVAFSLLEQDCAQVFEAIQREAEREMRKSGMRSARGAE